MLSCFRFFAVILLSTSALASELTVKVVDPQSASVPGAQVELFAEHSTRPAAVQSTSAQGIAHFRDVPSGDIRVHVLAPGFAEQWTPVSGPASEVTVPLQLAIQTETVVVTATRTPLPGDESGAAVATLSGAELEIMRPVAANDALRFLPGAVVSTAGQRGGLSSLFVRGGDSRYNKVIVDGVAVNDPGGTVDFGILPLFEADRLEFSRGAQSTLYGSDAMTSVVQFWSRTGTTPRPELRFGADSGNYGTETGYASLSGANGRFDYNLFGNQFNTSGSGPNADYSNSLEGLNAGAKVNDWASLRLRMRHDNSVSGVPGAWNYNGVSVFNVNGTPTALLPDLDQRARQNNFLGSLELALTGPSRWQHRLTGFDYTLHRSNTDFISQAGRLDAFGDNLDTPFNAITRINRAGFNYQGDYAERSWAVSTVGYEFEDENGTVGDLLSDSLSHGVRLNQAVFGNQTLTFGRASLVAGGRFVHNQSFGDRFVPRAALSLLVLRGGQFFTVTRLHFAYATGIKEPSFSESFGNGGGFPILPNPSLRPEETRALEAGFEQSFRTKYSLSALYFNNLFRNKIDFNLDPCFCTGQYVNVNEALAHGAEVGFNGKPSSHLSLAASYTYTSTQILKEPFAFDPLLSVGKPLIRRPTHSATTTISYLGSRWGTDLTGSFIGRRADSDFLGFGIDHAPGYVLVNAGGWYAIRARLTAYLNAENLLDRSYQEVTGYPALGINFRAGLRFRVGGE
jgi:outer membrane cobalamin receptor